MPPLGTRRPEHPPRGVQRALQQSCQPPAAMRCWIRLAAYAVSNPAIMATPTRLHPAPRARPAPLTIEHRGVAVPCYFEERFLTVPCLVRALRTCRGPCTASYSSTAALAVMSSGAAFVGTPAPGGGSAWLQRPLISMVGTGPRLQAAAPCVVAGPSQRALARQTGMAAVAVMQMLMVAAAPSAAGGWGSRRGS